MENIMIIGAGFMGSGIAQVCAQAGYSVSLVDVNEQALRTARRSISQSLEKLFSKGNLSEYPPTICARISYHQSLVGGASMDWIVETIYEDEAIKRELFKDLDRIAPAAIPLASNTSSIPITRLAAGLRFPERVLGLHFFGPVPLMPLVEVVSGEDTAPAIFERAVELVKILGKRPVRVNKDLPGFVMNRVFAAAFRECLELVSAGVASVEDIDQGMRLGYGWKIGPFEIADNAGIDTILRVSRSMLALGESQLAADLNFLTTMVDEGKLGRKSGRGFYRYSASGAKVGPENSE